MEESSEPFKANFLWKFRWKFRTFRCKIGLHTGPMTKTQPRASEDQVEVEHIIPGTLPRQGAHAKCGWCGTTWVMGFDDEWTKIKRNSKAENDKEKYA